MSHWEEKHKSLLRCNRRLFAAGRCVHVIMRDLLKQSQPLQKAQEDGMNWVVCVNPMASLDCVVHSCACGCRRRFSRSQSCLQLLRHHHPPTLSINRHTLSIQAPVLTHQTLQLAQTHTFYYCKLWRQTGLSPATSMSYANVSIYPLQLEKQHSVPLTAPVHFQQQPSPSHMDVMWPSVPQSYNHTSLKGRSTSFSFSQQR